MADIIDFEEKSAKIKLDRWIAILEARRVGGRMGQIEVYLRKRRASGKPVTITKTLSNSIEHHFKDKLNINQLERKQDGLWRN